MKLKLTATAMAVVLGAGLAAVAAPASARVVCNAVGDCWHVDNRVAYPGQRFVYHNDDWYFHQKWDDRHHWREHHEGRGYWANGVWVQR